MSLPARTRPAAAFALLLAALAAAAPGHAQVTLYEQDGFGGRAYTPPNWVSDLSRRGFNNRASSAVVRGERWEICEAPNFQGRCTVLRPGLYPSLRAMGLNDRVTSVRAVAARLQVEEGRYAPRPMVVNDYRRRSEETLFEAPVTLVRAVVRHEGRTCWREAVPAPAGGGSGAVPGALVGAVIGGILGHQIGSGSGRDLATAGGAVAGAVVGAQIGSAGETEPAPAQVQRCSTPAGEPPTYWNVTYTFRGQEHHVQLAAPPGATITVNRHGVPRA